jgi:hypothetical protein
MTDLRPEGSPSIDGPFVEVAPDTWVRASAVLAIERYRDEPHPDGPYPDEPHPETDEESGGAGQHGPFASVVVAGGSDDPVWWRSPYRPALLRGALRAAEHGERVRLLEALAGSPPSRSPTP